MTSWRTDKQKTAERGYGRRWQRLSKQFLRRPENALCVMCEAEGQTRQAEVVDHIVAHEGDEALFWGSGQLAGPLQVAPQPGQAGRGARVQEAPEDWGRWLSDRVTDLRAQCSA